MALVIGNAFYLHAPRPENLLNDAKNIRAVLGRLGSIVTRLESADYTTLRRGLREYASFL